MKRSINTVFYDIAVNTVGTSKVLAAATAGRHHLRPERQEGRRRGPRRQHRHRRWRHPGVDAGDGLGVRDVRRRRHVPHAAHGLAGPLAGRQDPLAGAGGRAGRRSTRRLREEPPDRAQRHRVAQAGDRVLAPGVRATTGPAPARPARTSSARPRTTRRRGWSATRRQLSAAVSMGAETPKGKQMPLRNSGGSIVYGSGLPGQIWQEFMQPVPEEQADRGVRRLRADR